MSGGDLGQAEQVVAQQYKCTAWLSIIISFTA